MQIFDDGPARKVTGLAMILGPGLALVGTSLFPSTSSDNTTWVAALGESPSRAAWGLVLFIAGLAISVFAYVGLMMKIRERHPVAAGVGGVMAVIGAVGLAGAIGSVLMDVQIVRTQGVSASTVDLITAVDDAAALDVLYALALVGVVGLVVLAYGLLRMPNAARWLSLPLAVGAVAQHLSIAGVGGLVTLIGGSACIFVALAPIGVGLLTGRAGGDILAAEPEFRTTPAHS